MDGQVVNEGRDEAGSVRKFLAILIEGAYHEHVPLRPGDLVGPTRAMRREAGDIAWRPADAAHRIALERDPQGHEIPVWTLFVTGRKVRDWGFWCPKGWTSWQAYTGQDDTDGPVRVGVVGVGCGED